MQKFTIMLAGIPYLHKNFLLCFVVTCVTNYCFYEAFFTFETGCLRDKLWKLFKCFVSKQNQIHFLQGLVLMLNVSNLLGLAVLPWLIKKEKLLVFGILEPPKNDLIHQLTNLSFFSYLKK